MSSNSDSTCYDFGWIDRKFERLMGRRLHGEEELLDLQHTGIERVDAISVYPNDDVQVTLFPQGDVQGTDIVQNAINSKIDRLSRYRQCKAKEVWLLVIGSAGTGGAMLVDVVDENEFVSPYDKTIFLELFEERCVVLNTRT
ncbi:MAG TPA: hypothetical protein VFT22_42625 [Kofleriaceae bacterium]|nr:hypothetical protein [Kofleriaceae bacterium]